MKFDQILKKLPYQRPFLFVDALNELNENGVTGSYRFPEDSDFYSGHFINAPVTPGVILTECCAQIGVVCLGLFLLEDSNLENLKIGMSSSEMEFYTPVFPNERVKVISEKVYFRFNKLKCNVKMFNEKEELVCKGTLAGMFKTAHNE
ncbi:hydroxymyristoyl-ACP dehydratase [Aurantibacter sp.]|uniref:3-hydroxyacyl-ACP dehydratase FabZ family protein n=1 Tax=Aurantibacter sp. TaxID=2807103 RepID=UPI0032668AD0